MNRQISFVLYMAALAIMVASCNKENSAGEAALSGTSQLSVSNAQAIAVAASGSGDSIYLVNTCGRNAHRDTVSFESLPAASKTYIAANYAGYTQVKAYAVKDQAGTVTGWVAVIRFNGNPVGLAFDASGAFVRVLEQREGADLNGPGWHRGGHFDDRGGARRDSIAIAALPSAVTGYFAANYAQDTLVRAFRNKDSSIVVISSGNGLYATVFSTTGAFVSRASVPSRQGRASLVSISALPANVQSYLTATYPNYVLKQAFSMVKAQVVQGYVVIIDANATKYAVAFDASGAFVQAVTIR